MRVGRREELALCPLQVSGANVYARVGSLTVGGRPREPDELRQLSSRLLGATDQEDESQEKPAKSPMKETSGLSSLCPFSGGASVSLQRSGNASNGMEIQ